MKNSGMKKDSLCSIHETERSLASNDFPLQLRQAGLRTARCTSILVNTGTESCYLTAMLRRYLFPAITRLTLYSLLSPLSSMTKCPAPTKTPVSRLLYLSQPLSKVTLMTRWCQHFVPAKQSITRHTRMPILCCFRCWTASQDR